MDAPALSNIDLSRKLAKYGLTVPFIPYHEVRNIPTIDAMLPFFLLYELHNPVGHWTTLWRDSKGKINYFDSTGHVPDQLMRTNFDNGPRKKLGADYTYLVRLLAQEQEPLIYNEKPLQNDGSNTCGYWAACRLIFGDVANDTFNHHFLPFSDVQRQKAIVKLYNIL